MVVMPMPSPRKKITLVGAEVVVSPAVDEAGVPLLPQPASRVATARLRAVIKEALRFMVYIQLG